jgi:hypothetical protein
MGRELSFWRETVPTIVPKCSKLSLFAQKTFLSPAQDVFVPHIVSTIYVSLRWNLNTMSVKFKQRNISNVLRGNVNVRNKEAPRARNGYLLRHYAVITNSKGSLTTVRFTDILSSSPRNRSRARLGQGRNATKYTTREGGLSSAMVG